MNHLTRFAFLATAGAAVSKLLGQTRTSLMQIKYPPSPGPSMTVVFADGTLRQVIIGTGLTLVNASGVHTINAATPPAVTLPVPQRLLVEPDGLSWRIPVPYTNPYIYRNGMRMLVGEDYVLEVDPVSGKQVVRPTAKQGTALTDFWIAS